MPAIGDTLRDARMRQRIEIGEVEARTKIRAKYLRALENEQFDLLPGSTYVKTFLRTYAEFLGLDAQLLVEEYRVHHEPRAEADAQHFAPGPPPRREPVYGRPSPRRGAVVAAVVASLLAFILILGVTGEEGGDGGSADRDPGAERAPAPSPPPEAREEEPERAPRPRVVSLRVAPAGPTYLCVDDGAGRVLYEGIVTTPRAFRGRRLRINLGRTSAQVRVNGRRVPIEAGPESVGFDFTPARRRALEEQDRPGV